MSDTLAQNAERLTVSLTRSFAGMRQAADTVKKLTMELGGHAPVLVFPDVDIAAVARSCVAILRIGVLSCESFGIRHPLLEHNSM